MIDHRAASNPRGVRLKGCDRSQGRSYGVASNPRGVRLKVVSGFDGVGPDLCFKPTRGSAESPHPETRILRPWASNPRGVRLKDDQLDELAIYLAELQTHEGFG